MAKIDYSWTDKDKKFLLEHHKEMSITEMAIALDGTDNRIKNGCNRIGCSAFNENPKAWKNHNYIFGSNGYAMYPFKGDYKQSMTVTNKMLEEAH